MKVDKNNAKLEPANQKAIHDSIKAADTHLQYQGLLCLLADAIDMAIRGDDCWVSVGLTRPKDAIIMTCHVDGAKAMAAGLTLAELSRDAERLL